MRFLLRWFYGSWQLLILVEFYGLGHSFFKINDIKFSSFFTFNDQAFYQFRRPHFLDLVIFIFSIAVTLFGDQLSIPRLSSGDFCVTFDDQIEHFSKIKINTFLFRRPTFFFGLSPLNFCLLFYLCWSTPFFIKAHDQPLSIKNQPLDQTFYFGLLR